MPYRLPAFHFKAFRKALDMASVKKIPRAIEFVSSTTKETARRFASVG